MNAIKSFYKLLKICGIAVLIGIECLVISNIVNACMNSSIRAVLNLCILSLIIPTIMDMFFFYSSVDKSKIETTIDEDGYKNNPLSNAMLGFSVLSVVWLFAMNDIANNGHYAVFGLMFVIAIVVLVGIFAISLKERFLQMSQKHKNIRDCEFGVDCSEAESTGT